MCTAVLEAKVNVPIFGALRKHAQGQLQACTDHDAKVPRFSLNNNSCQCDLFPDAMNLAGAPSVHSKRLYVQCMYIYIYTYTCVYVCIQIYKYIYTYTCYICVYKYLHVHLRLYVYVYIYIYTHMCVCICILYIYIYVYMNI